ncbi:uncharacterized protein MAL13P1.304-like [Cataglyphis hispanica]|uniref:uncharacterized protein MAL13P1.304-like n=1 Tax=Cataglyphis hispanica TaxID=1086592 RepID=UPI002180435F|nr:uncharacterized protein MAL13P1.304-like [Cataglyphis hispanica]
MARSTDREMLKRKRCRKDLDKLHSKILKAKKKLDNVGKYDGKDRQRRQGKICSRLLPRAAIGIYRNGAKSKNIQKGTSASTFNRARLKADALKLFNGDTPEFKYEEELSTHNETTKQSPNKNFVKNSLKFWTPGSILEQSPILQKKQSKNQKPYLVKKKSEENFFENFDSDKISKQNVNNGSKYVAQKESIYKQKLFQNDKEQPKTTQKQIFENIDFKEENRTQQTCEDNKSTSRILKHYREACKINSAISFEDFLQNYQPDPLTTIIKKLKHIYSNSLHEQYLHGKNRLKTMKSSKLSVENQTCTYLDDLQISPKSTSTVEYEVPKCNENRTISPFLKDIPKEDDKINFLQNDNIEPYDSISHSSQNILEAYDTNDCIINRKNNDNQYSKQLPNIHQSKRVSFNSVNEKDFVRKHSNYTNQPSKNKRHNKNNFYVDFLDHDENSQYIDNTKQAEISTFSSDSMLLAKKYSSKNDVSKESPNNIFDRITNKCNAKNIKRPVILRRHNNVTVIKDNHSVQKNDEDLFYKKSYMEKVYEQFGININNKNLDNNRHAYVDSSRQQFLHEKNKQELEIVKSPDLPVEYQACIYSDVSLVSPNSSSIFEIDCETPKYRKNHTITFPLIRKTSQKENKFHLMQSNKNRYNDITKESYEMQFPNASENFPTPSIINAQFMNFHDRTKMFESQKRSMEIKDSQESLVEKFDINMHPNKLNGRNKSCQFDDSLQTLEVSYNTNAYIERLARKQEDLPKVKEHLFHSHNYNAINYLRGANPCNFNVKPSKTLSQQTKLHTCERNDSKQEFLQKNPHNRNQNVLLNNINARAISSTLNFQNIQTDKRFGESTCKEIFSKADVECARNRVNLSHCNEQYLDTTRCQHNFSTHHFDKRALQTMVQPRILHEDHNCNRDNCINSSNDVPLLLLQKHNAYTYPKVIDDQHCSVMLQNIAQPIKYLALNNNSDIQRIPVYINEKNVIENVPLKVITLVKPNAQTEELYFHKKYNLRRE